MHSKIRETIVSIFILTYKNKTVRSAKKAEIAVPTIVEPKSAKKVEPKIEEKKVEPKKVEPKKAAPKKSAPPRKIF